MKFMQAAEGRKRAKNDEDIERLRKELAVMDGEEESDSETEDGGLGRAIFGPKSKAPVVVEKMAKQLCMARGMRQRYGALSSPWTKPRSTQ